MAKGVSLKRDDHEDPKVCVPCIEKKQHKVYNRHMPATRMAKRLEMVNSDTYGPFRIPSKAEAQVFGLFLDNHMRMVWYSFMKSKADTAKALLVFKVKVEKYSGEKMMHFRCDNGKAEYDKAIF